jgi:hypothetical protein
MVGSVIGATDSASPAVALIFGGLVVAYFIPSFIAKGREVKNAKSVYVVNIFLGWTFIGWVVALAMAVRSDEPKVQSVPCRACGMGLKPGQKFCEHCGTSRLAESP